MCLILLAWHAHPDYPLVFAGNRDEAYERPAAPADYWNDAPDVYGGRDLEKSGTWLGLTLAGRFAAVTNYRDGPARTPAPRSRGTLRTGGSCCSSTAWTKCGSRTMGASSPC